MVALHAVADLEGPFGAGRIRCPALGQVGLDEFGADLPGLMRTRPLNIQFNRPLSASSTPDADRACRRRPSQAATTRSCFCAEASEAATAMPTEAASRILISSCLSPLVLLLFGSREFCRATYQAELLRRVNLRWPVGPNSRAPGRRRSGHVCQGPAFRRTWRGRRCRPRAGCRPRCCR